MRPENPEVEAGTMSADRRRAMAALLRGAQADAVDLFAAQEQHAPYPEPGSAMRLLLTSSLIDPEADIMSQAPVFRHCQHGTGLLSGT